MGKLDRAMIIANRIDNVSLDGMRQHFRLFREDKHAVVEKYKKDVEENCIN